MCSGVLRSLTIIGGKQSLIEKHSRNEWRCSPTLEACDGLRTLGQVCSHFWMHPKCHVPPLMSRLSTLHCLSIVFYLVIATWCAFSAWRTVKNWTFVGDDDCDCLEASSTTLLWLWSPYAPILGISQLRHCCKDEFHCEWSLTEDRKTFADSSASFEALLVLA